MPLPLIPVILGGISLATGAWGVKKGVDAYSDFKKAEEYHNDARNLYEKANGELEGLHKEANAEFENLGQLKAKSVQGSLKRYEQLMEKLKIDYEKDLDGLLKQLDTSILKKVKQELVNLETAVTGLVSSAAGGAFAGFGAFGAAGLLGTASTGTAIGSLSGAAATNATLAWFGGGSLAAGGLGIAGGMWVLGGLVAAPVILVAGSIFAAHAEKKKYNALSYYMVVEALSQKLKSEGLLWKEVKNKTMIIQKTIEELDKNLNDFAVKIETYADMFGVEVGKWKQEYQNQLLATTQTAKTLIVAIEAPILNDTDENTIKIMELQKECKQLMEEIEATWGEKK